MMPAVKKVTARGKRYAYIRGTNIALVRGFIGTEDQFSSVVAAAASCHEFPSKAGFVDFSRLQAAKDIHKRALARSRDAGRSYTLSVDAINEMLVASGDRCTLTNLPLDYHRRGNARRPMGPSLDRIDNRLGYDPTNVRVVCACVNMALNEWGAEHFETICRAFLENRMVQIGKRRANNIEIGSANNGL